MIDQGWKATQAERLGFDAEQMETLLRIAAMAYKVANQTTYDELASHLLVRNIAGRIDELKRMAILLGDDTPVPLTMRHGKCGRQAWWHVRHITKPDEFFCLIHTPSDVPAAKYAGVEFCQSECVIIKEAA